MHRIASAIFLLFGAAVIGFVYLKPGWEEFSALRERIARLEEINKKLDALSTARDELQDQIDAIPAEKRERLEHALPEGINKIGLLLLLEDRAERSSVVLENVLVEKRGDENQPAPVQPVVPQPRPVGGLPQQSKLATKSAALQVNIQATYQTFKDFLTHLENSLRLIDIEDVSFAAPPAEDKHSSFHFSGKTYHQ